MNYKIDLKKFYFDIKKIKEDTLKQINTQDLDHLVKVKKIATYTNVAGKFFLHTSLVPINPLWLLGAALLSIHTMIETSEFLHNISHGQYDRIPFKEAVDVTSNDHQPNIPIDKGNWKREHNRQHHAFTNVIDKDPDLKFFYFRHNPSIPWEPFYAFQLIISLSIAPIFNYALGAYMDCIANNYFDKSEIIKKTLSFVFEKHIKPSVFSGPFFLNYISGSLLAEMIGNINLYCVMICGHFPMAAEVFLAPAESEAEFFLHQILATCNVKRSSIYSTITGALDRHIEHHLFPQFPQNRLREVSKKIKNLCSEYDIPYNENTLFKQCISAHYRLLKYSFPKNLECFLKGMRKDSQITLKTIYQKFFHHGSDTVSRVSSTG